MQSLGEQMDTLAGTRTSVTKSSRTGYERSTAGDLSYWNFLFLSCRSQCLYLSQESQL